MIKLCFTATVPFALETFVLETAKELYHTGLYDITFICAQDEEFRHRLPSYIHYIPIDMKRGKDFRAVGALVSYIRILKNEKFDIIQYSTNNASLYGSISSFFCRVPVRLYAQWGVHYRNMEKGIHRFTWKLFEKLLCVLSTDVWSQSQLHMKLCIDDRMYREPKCRVLGKGGTIGVDLNEFDYGKKTEWNYEIRKEYNIPEDVTVFGFAGRITRDKGIIEFISAFRLLLKAHKDVRMLLVGDFDVNNNLDKGIIGWLQTSPYVIITGKQIKNNMSKFYSAMDVYVHPTYREGFGMAIQEAGSLGIPVVTTNIPGASEVLEDGVSCKIVPLKNVDKLYAVMAQLYQSPLERKQIGENAREFVMANYERSIMIKRQIDAYNGLYMRVIESVNKKER